MRNKCYRHSRLATLPIALTVALHRKLNTWSTDVDAFIALSRFQADLLVAAGLPADRVHVKPNFYPAPPNPRAWSEREARVLYVGRLSEEKGPLHLIDAWARMGSHAPLLDIIGSGPQSETLRCAVSGSAAASRIRLLGQLPHVEVEEAVSRSRLLIVPSVWFEGFPMVIREAFALAVPVAASNIGSLASIVTNGGNGILFAPGNPSDIARAVLEIWNDPRRLEMMGAQARRDFEAKYTEKAHSEAILKIYDAARTVRATRNCFGDRSGKRPPRPANIALRLPGS